MASDGQGRESLDEIWAPVPGYEGSYEASNLGRIRGLDRVISRRDGTSMRIKGKVQSQSVNNSGRMQVSIDGRCQQAHPVIAAAFLGPKPAGMEVCHNNGDPTDNRVVNLRYDTHVNNALDMVNHGRTKAARTHCTKGHEFTEANTYRAPKEPTARICRACNLEANRRYRNRKAAR